jgi:HEPN domain-containing protein
VRQLEKSAEPVHDLVCFHCQQLVEKYLKALLEESGLVVPRTHDLEWLLSLLPSAHPILSKMKRGLQFLSRHAVDTRYPGENATQRQADAALRWAERARQECRTLLGIKPPRK